METPGCRVRCKGQEGDLKQVALVHQLPLPLLQLGPQPPQLALILAQQGALVHILIHPGCIADVLGPICKLQCAQGLCRSHRKGFVLQTRPRQPDEEEVRSEGKQAHAAQAIIWHEIGDSELIQALKQTRRKRQDMSQTAKEQTVCRWLAQSLVSLIDVDYGGHQSKHCLFCMQFHALALPTVHRHDLATHLKHAQHQNHCSLIRSTQAKP